VGALGGKVRPSIITFMILPLKAKCFMWKLIINASFTCMIDSRVWLQSFLDLKTFVK
jgi:hypothetical protein